jgi:hypothetical protein
MVGTSAFGVVGREHAGPDGSKLTYDVSAVTGWRIDTDLARATMPQFCTASSSGRSANSPWGVNLNEPDAGIQRPITSAVLLLPTATFSGRHAKTQ